MTYLWSDSGQYTTLPEMKHFKNSTMGEPRQLDGSSCGVFVCIVSYLEIINYCTFKINQKQVDIEMQ